MLISSLNTSSYLYTPATVTTLDSTGKLFKAKAPSPTSLGDSNGMAAADVFIYSRMGMTANTTAPSRGVVLENADGSYFKLDLGNTDKTSLVAKGGKLELYVYRPDTTTAEKYEFDKKGVFTQASALDVESFSAAEVSSRRDLDGNGSIGAKLLTTQTLAANDPITTGVSKATGGIYNVNVMGHDIYVVGNRVDRLKRIDASAITLKNADGTFWQPPSDIQTLRAVSTTTPSGTSWEVYGTAAEDTSGDGFAVTTKFSFGTNNKLSSTAQLSAEEVIAAEVSAKKDLNVDGAYGLTITSPIDAAGGLVQGKLAGQDVLLAKVASTDTTGGRAVSLGDLLLDVDGSAWKLPSAASTAGYALKSIVKDSVANTATVYATKTGGNDVLKFDFSLNADNRYEIDENTAAGVTVTAMDMALAERTQKRDLNGDSKFGATIDSLEDKQTKLYKATMMGKEFYLAGDLDGRTRVTARSATAAQSLGGALLNTDGTAWEARVGGTSYTVKAMLNTDTTAGSREYTVYAKAGSEVRKFVFTENANGDFKIDATKPNGEILDDPIAMAALEKTTRRDINGDLKFGATIADTFDTAVGLYKATIGSNDYYLAGQDASGQIRTTGLTGALAQDLSGAMLNEDGTAWSLPTDASSYTLTSIVDTSSGGTTSYSVFATKNSGDDVLRFDFEEDADGNLKVTSDSRAGVAVTAADMAAAEDLYNRDLNQDALYGAEIGTTVIDRTAGLYTASLMGQDFYLAGHEASGALRKTATNGTDAKALAGVLKNTDGSAWDVKTGYTASSLVKTSAANAATTTYTLYAYKTGDKADVLSYDFEEDSDGNFVVTNDTIAGVAMSADAMALKEASLKRDLNSDGVFGVQLSNTLDAVGGLYQVSALGGNFLLAGGVNLQASANAPLDLSKALLDSDGNAWSPEDVADVTASKLSLVPTATGGTFTVYVKNDTGSASDFTAYDFVGYQQSGNSRDLSAEDIATIEKAKGRDISGDGLYGANIKSSPDLLGGLYRGDLGSHTDVYFKADPNLALGSLVASQALDASSALKTAQGYWAKDTGFNVQTAFSDGTDFVLIATNATHQVRRYTFDTTKDNQIDLAKSGLMTDLEVADLEKAQGRDLNKDKVLSVRVNTTALDAVGGLFKGNNGQNDYLIVSDTASGITDLSGALLNANGSRWNPGSYDRLVLDTVTSGGSTTGYNVYAKATSAGATTYTRYSFDADYKLTATSSALSDLEVGLAETSISRDINGDNAVGAKVTEALHRNSGLYAGEVNGTDMVLLAHNASGVANTTVAGASSMDGRILYGKDGATAWDPSGYTLQKAAFNLTAGSVSSIYVYAEKDADNTFHRFMFTADHVLVSSEALSDEQKAASVMADDPAGSYVDSTGGLFKATVLGQNFYVVGDTTGGEAAVQDLSKALFDGDGNIWAPGADYKIGGMVTNEDGSGDPVTYDVYTFKMGTGATADQVVSVQKSTWDASMNFMGTKAADPALLANLEKTQQRDLSGDSVTGFKVTTLDPSLGYKGVTGATMVNGATYLLAGSDLAVGSSTTALGLDKVLLNADGSAPWMPATAEKVKFVDERSTGDETRYVYAINDSVAVDTAMRYEFNKTSGKLVGSGTAVSLFELAQLEESKNTDINDDNYVGAVTVSVYRDDSADPSPSYGTDLLSADFGGERFLIVNDATTGAGKLTMSGALLNQDGSAWSLPASFTLKGIYQQDGPTSGLTAKPLELYGLNEDGAIQQYRFAPNVDQYGARTSGYTLMDAKVNSDGVVNPVRGSVLADTELTAALDLNGDGAIGYLKGSTVVRADSGSTSNSWTLGTAAVSNGSAADADEIYVVSQDFAATSSVSGSADVMADNTVASGALWAAGGTAYWKPDTGYTVTSVLSSAADQVEVWAQGTASDGSKVYQQYVFDGSGGKWTAAASSLVADADIDGDTTMDSLSTTTMLGEEVNATRDLNGDGAVGLKISSRTSGTGGSNTLYEAQVDGKSYFILGDDTTVATGTASAPADPDTLQILKNADGTLWAPSGTVGSIRLANATDIAAADAIDSTAPAAYTVVDGSTDVYFTSGFLRIEAA